MEKVLILPNIMVLVLGIKIIETNCDIDNSEIFQVDDEGAGTKKNGYKIYTRGD